MTRRCSHCSNNGHNSRTCPNRGVKFFGVRITDGSVRKSASMGNLNHYTGSRSSNLLNGFSGGGTDLDSPGDTSDHNAAADGYWSEDFVDGSSSGRERKKDLPGLYYDAERNKYFPIKSRIPGAGAGAGGSSSTSVQKTSPKFNKPNYGKGDMIVKMLQVRELCGGNSIISNKKKVNFQHHYQNIQTSKPIIWKYQGTDRTADAALEHVYVHIQTPHGLAKSEILLTAGLNNTFCYWLGEALSTLWRF